MKSFGHKALVTLFIMLFNGCERNVTITDKFEAYDARKHLIVIHSDEKLPNGVREILAVESVDKKDFKKFPLAYYLIQEEDIKFMHVSSFDSDIISHLRMTISGIKYYKLFVHPDSDFDYSFLKSAYRYIGPTQTEFVGSMLVEDKTIVVWSDDNPGKKAFVVKTKIDEATKKGISSRKPASFIESVPDMATLFFNRPLKGRKDSIEGQQVTKIPDYNP